ncbi:MAG: YdeI/OmpD-associated family protein [Rubricoccaceae bacterium]|nr:YdeI/OmpD-associated family protein [Rubricoccaceae bacterium]
MGTHRKFTAKILKNDRGGAYVVVPFDVEDVFKSKRPKIKATFDGVPYRGSLVRMGSEHHILGIRRDIRDEIGKQPGDDVNVTVELDTEPRVVDVPDDFADALKPYPEARAFFEGLSYTHQKEYVRWITEAKRAETRERRISKGLEMLRSEVKTPD